ncbi:MAG: hypothetical protein E7604_06770 [Ruminococcaceae bacterium]|nr:hypothetical protein [Oscillospiraceae bacterium]
MKLIAPAYYPQFSCIAGDCRHSCCIGWEIDIDADSCARFLALEGAFGARLRANIDADGEAPHFRLCGEEERCPFLNERGLCDIILTLGEEALCQICTDHPRWRNFYADRTEIGLGLCCEAAAALVLGWEAPVSMICLSDDGENAMPTAEEAAFFSLRDDLLAMAQNREKLLDERIADMLASVGGVRYQDMTAWGKFFSGLEILDCAWVELLSGMDGGRTALPGHAGEQLISYLLLRHLPKVLDGEDAAVIVSFAVLAFDLTQALFAQCEVQDFSALCDIVRLFSSEIEYSEENMYAVFDEIASS